MISVQQDVGLPYCLQVFVFPGDTANKITQTHKYSLKSRTASLSFPLHLLHIYRRKTERFGRPLSYLGSAVPGFLKRYQGSKRIYFEISTLHKDLSWSYEKEWRIIKAGTTFATMSKPSAIYLGVNIDDEDRKKITEWCNSCNIPIFNMRQKGNEYKLVPKRIFQAQIQSSKEVQACEVL